MKQLKSLGVILFFLLFTINSWALNTNVTYSGIVCTNSALPLTNVLKNTTPKIPGGHTTSGFWTAVSPGISISNPTDPNALATGFPTAGSYTLLWTHSSGHVYTVTFTVTSALAPNPSMTANGESSNLLMCSETNVLLDAFLNNYSNYQFFVADHVTGYNSLVSSGSSDQYTLKPVDYDPLDETFVVVTAANGCQNISNSVLISDVQNVEVQVQGGSSVCNNGVLPNDILEVVPYSPGSFTYYWHRGSTTFAPNSGPTIAITSFDDYWVEIVNAACPPGSWTSNVVSVRNYELPDVSLSPVGPIEVCPTNPISVPLTAVLATPPVNSIFYEWYDNGTILINSMTGLPVTGSSYQAVATGSYKTIIREVNNHECWKESAPVSIIPTNISATFTAANATTFCSTPYSALMSLSITGGIAPYIITFSDLSTQSVPANSTITRSISATTTFQITNIQDASGCAIDPLVLPASVTFTRELPPASYSVVGSSICSPNPLTVGLFNSEANVTYVLLYNDGVNPSQTVESITRLASGAFSFTAINNPLVGTYSVVARKGTCTDVPMNGSLTVVSSPQTYIFSFLQTKPYCSGNTLTPQLSGSQIGVDYTLYRDGGIIQSLAGTGGVLTFNDQTVAGVYTVRADNHICPFVQMTASADAPTIVQSPNVYIVTGGVACENIGVNINLTATQPGVRYDLYRDGVGPIASLTGSANFGLQTTPGVYTIQASNVTCSIPMQGNATVNASPLNTIPFVTSGQVCPSGVVALQTSQAGILYSLYRNNGPTGVTRMGTGGAITFGLQNVAGIYTVVATNTATNCAVTLLNSLEIMSEPINYILSANKLLYCGNLPLSGVNLTLSGTQTNVDYQLFQNGLQYGAPISTNGVDVPTWNNVPAGTYFVTASNTGGCSVSSVSSVTIATTVPPTATIFVQGADRRCENIPGTFTVLVNLVGSPPFNFSISDDKGNPPFVVPNYNTNQYTYTVNPNATTTYTVSALSDNAGCSAVGSGSATVYVDPRPTITFTGSTSVCIGSSTTITAQGAGVGGSYVWSTSATTPSITVSPNVNTTYDVIATTARGCVNNASANVVVNSLPVVSFTGFANPPVYCSNNPRVTLTGSPALGGIFSGSGIVNGNEFDPSMAVIGRNDIVYTYTDGNGCTNSSPVQSVWVNQIPTVNIQQLPRDYCSDDGPDTWIGVPTSANGTFLIQTPGANWTDNGDGTATFNPSASIPGTDYTVRYTFTDGNGCVNSINEIARIHPDLRNQVFFTGFNGPYCEGDNVNVLLTGSKAPGGTFTGPAGLTDNGNGTATFNPGAIGNGAHTVTYSYTDPNTLCSASSSQTLNVGTPLSFSLANRYCKSDPATVLTGNPAGGVFNIVSPSGVVSNVPDVSPWNPALLESGTFTVTYTYTDGNGCLNTLVRNIEIVPLPDAGFTGLDNEYCVNDLSSTLVPNVPTGFFSGPGISMYDFFPNVAGVSVPGTPHQVTYSVTINGCTNSTTQPVTVVELPDIDIAGLNATYCDRDAIVTITGSAVGVAGPVGTFVSTTNTTGVSPIIDNLDGTATFNPIVGQGTYLVTMTYEHPLTHCIESKTQTVIVYETTPVDFGGLLPSFCRDHAPVLLTATFTNGVPVGGGAFSGNGITDNGNGTAWFDPSVPSVGFHPITFTFTNNNGCLTSRTNSVEIMPYPTTFTVQGGGNYCIGGVGMPVTLSGSQLNVNYQLLLNGNVVPGVGALLPGDGNALSFGNRTPEGIYTVRATNTISGCTVLMASNAVIAINDIQLVLTSTNVSCRGGNDGEITVVPSGGTANYSYAWVNTLAPATVIGTADVLPSLVAGTYRVTVTDAIGCVKVSSDVTITEPAADLLITKGPEIPASCGCTFGVDCDGSASVTVTGGTPNYTILWTNSFGSIVSASSSATDLEAGVYSVTVTDAKGCSAVETINIGLLPVITIVEDITQHINNNCFGGVIGQFAVIANGGSGAFEYSLDNVSWQSSATFSNKSAGSYSVWVRDQSHHRCVYQMPQQITITEPAPLGLTEIVLNHKNVDCDMAANGAFEVLPSGGSGNYEFSIDGGLTWSATSAYSNQTNGVYYVWVRDALATSCIYTNMPAIVITEPLPLSLVSTVQNASCFAAVDGVVTLTASGGHGSYLYSNDAGVTWQASNQFTGGAGTYSYRVKDSQALSFCQTADLFATITDPGDINITEDLTEHKNINCSGDTNGQFRVNPFGGADLFSIDSGTTWQNSRTFFGLSAGTYLVSIKNSTTGCEKLDYLPITITEPIAPLNIDSFILTDATCYGVANGEASVVASGGTINYTYQWFYSNGNIVPAANGGNTSAITGVKADTYELIITDANGCSVTANYTISQPNDWNVIYSTTAPTTNTATDGVINITSITGQIPPYTVTWTDNGSNAWLRNNLPAGPYRFTVSTTAFCSKVYDVTLSAPGPLTVVATPVATPCFNTNKGSINVEIREGDAPFTLTWSGNLASGTILGNTVIPNVNANSVIPDLYAGTYTINVVDNIGQTYTNSNVVVTQPVQTSLAQSVNQDISCYGVGDGQLGVALVGRPVVATDLIEWSGAGGFYRSGQFSAEALQTNLQAEGDYHVLVTDLNGCELSTTLQLVEPDELVITQLDLDATTCFGGTDGRIEIAVSGRPAGNGFVYNWEKLSGVVWQSYQLNGTQVLSGLSAGTYRVVVQCQSTNCTVTSQSYIITQSTPIVLNTNVEDIKTCNGDNQGRITIGVSGGQAPYTVSYSPTDIRVGNGPFVFSNLPAGSYNFVVTDANGCQPAVIPVYTINQPVAFSVTNIVSQIDCSAINTGSLLFNVQGGVVSGGNHQYNIILQGAVSQSLTTNVLSGNVYSANFNALPEGNYKLTVIDNYAIPSTGCQVFTYDFELKQIKITGTITDAACIGVNSGEITNVAVSGSSGNYSFVWSTLNGVGLDPLSLNQTGLSSGTYTLTITDNVRTCSVAQDFEIKNATSISVNAALQEVSCFGLTDGAINNVTVIGGTPAYTFTWQGPDIVNASQQNQSNLAGGTYLLTVEDINGCVANNSFFVAAPDVISFDLSTTLTSCAPYQRDIHLTNLLGGTGNPNLYEFYWNGPGIANVQSRDLIGLTKGGLYEVTAYDQNRCVVQSSITIPGEMVIDATVTDVKCFNNDNGSIVLALSGGTGPFTYQWTKVGDPTFNSTNKDLNNLYAGDYTVVVTDNGEAVGANCTKTKTFTVAQPAEIVVTGVATDIICAGNKDGQININVVGGTPPYSYSWSSPNGTGLITTNKNQIALSGGSYSVVVTDALGCFSLPATFTVNEPLPLSFDLIATDTQCDGTNGTLEITNITGGRKPGVPSSYSYKWAGPSITSANETNAIINNAVGGDYTVVLSDITVGVGQQCVLSKSVSLHRDLVVTAQITPETCEGILDGAIKLNIDGGQPPYSFSWIGANFQSNDGDQSGLKAGTYQLTITDSRLPVACSKTYTYSVNTLNTLSLLSAIDDIICFGNTDGAIDISVSGGSNSYNYQWNGTGTGIVATSEDQSGLSVGSYTVRVTDVTLGCQMNRNFVVNAPALPLMIDNIQTTDVLCKTTATGSATVTVSGGTAPYDYFWTGPNGMFTNAATQNNLIAGDYTVKVVDANGCIVLSSTIKINEPATSVDVSLIGKSNVTSTGGNDGFIDIQPSGGTGSYTIAWTGVDLSNNPIVGLPINVTHLGNIGAGTYNATVTDANGCAKTINNIFISQPQATLQLVVSYTDILPCSNENNGEIFVNVLGGTLPYTISWSDGSGQLGSVVDSKTTISNLPAAVYTITVVDANNITVSQSVTISEPTPLALQASVINNVICYQGNNGLIRTRVAGGVPISGSLTYRVEIIGASYNDVRTNVLASTDVDFTNLYAGDYTVRVTDDSNQDGKFDINTDCWRETTLQLTQPEADVVLSGTTAICNGDAVALKLITGNWNPVANPLTVLLSDGTSVVVNSTPFTINLTPAVSTSYQIVSVTDGLGCAKGVGSGNALVTVHPLPTATISNINSDEICVGESTSLVIDFTGAQPWSVTYSDGTNSVTTSGVTTTPLLIPVSPTVTSQYQITAVNDKNCVGTFSGTANVVVNPLPASSLQGDGNDDICEGLSTDIIFTFNSGTAPWSVTYTENGVSKTIPNILLNPYRLTVSPTVLTDYILTKVTDSNGCDELLNDLVTVTVQPNPADAGAITGDITVCQSQKNVAYSVVAVANAVGYNWTVPVGATIVAGAGTRSILVDFGVNAVSGFVTVEAQNSCNTSNVSQLMVSVNSLPPAPTISGASRFCQGEKGILLNATTSAIASSYQWNLPAGFIAVAGSNSASIIIDLDPTVASMTGVVTVQAINSCGMGATSIPFNVEIVPLPTANAGVDAPNLCQNFYTLQATPVGAGYTGTWSVKTGSGVISAADINNPTATITNLSQGQNSLIWSVRNNTTNCIVDDEVILTNNLLTVTVSSSSAVVCDGKVTLYGTNLQTGTTGLWSFVQGNGSFANAADANTIVSNLDPDVNTIQWTINKNGCSSSAQLPITNNKPDDALISAEIIQLCTNTTTLSANTPVEGVGKWTVVTGMADIASPLNAVTNLNNLSRGENVIEWRISKNGCSSVDEVTVNNNTLAVSAGTDVTSCDGTVQLDGSALPVGATGFWEISSTAVVFQDATLNNTNVTNLANGINQFSWNVTLNGCVSTDDVIVTNDKPSTAIVGSTIKICADTAQLNAVAPTIGTGRWHVVSGAAYFDNANQPNTIARNLAIGENVLAWVVTQNGCQSSANLIVESTKVFVDAGKDFAICTKSTVLNANAPIGSATGEWSIVTGQGGATFPNGNLYKPNAIVSGLAYGSNAFVWSITDQGCTSRDTIVVTNNSPETANAGGDQSFVNSVTTMAATPATIGVGTWSLLNGGGDISAADIHNPYARVTNIRSGANVFRWSVEYLGCVSTDDVTLTNGQTVPAEAGFTPQIICLPETQLEANEAEFGYGEWSVFSGTGKFVDATNFKTKVYDIGPGRNVYKWTIYYTNSFSSDTVEVYNNQPTKANAGLDRSTCLSSFTLEGNIPSIGTAKWDLLSGGGTFADDTNPNTVVSNLAQGINLLKYEISNLGCSSIDSVRITNQMPTISNAGSDQTICEDFVELHPNTPSYGTGEWLVVTGSAKFVDGYARDLAPGANQLAWVITSGSCSSTDIITIVNNKPSTAFAGLDRPICEDFVNLSATQPQYGTGAWTLIAGSGTIANDLLPNTAVTGLAKGINRFRWLVDNNGCTSSDEVMITNNLIDSDAGVDIVSCVDSASLQANIATPGVGTWGIQGGTGSANFDQPNNPYTKVRNLERGDNVLIWKIEHKGCISISSVTVTNNKPTDAYAGSNVALCDSFIVLSANQPSVGVGSWFLKDGSGVFDDILKNNAKVSELGFGKNIFRWEINNQNCISYDDVEIQYNKIQAHVGNDQTTCSDNTLLEANNASPGIGTWSVVGGAGQAVFEDSNVPSTKVSNLARGDNRLKWTIANKGCITSDEVVITNNSPTTAYAGGAVEACLPDIYMDATEVEPGYGVGHWEILTGSGVIVDPNNPKTQVNGLSKGENRFLWVVTKANCVSTDDVLITNNQPSTPYAGADESTCESSTLLKANTPDFGLGNWSVVQGAGIFSSISAPRATVTSLGSGVNIFKWTITSGQCTLSDEVYITNSKPTVANAGPDIQDCKSWSVLDGNVPIIGVGTWSLSSGHAKFLLPNDAKTKVEELAFGENILRWTITQGECFSYDEVKISNKVPDQSNAGIDRTVCETYITLNANNPTSGVGKWTLLSGKGVFEDASKFDTKINSLGFGDNVLKWTISYGSCSTSDLVTIRRNKADINAGPDAVVYVPQYELRALNPGVVTGEWKVIGGTGTFDNSKNYNTWVRNISPGFNTYSWGVNVDGCISEDEISIEYRVVPNALFSVDYPEGCYPLDVKCTNNTIGDLTYQWVFGDGATSTERNPEHTYTRPGTYKLTLTVPGPDGKDGFDEQLITVYDHPVADFRIAPTLVYIPGDDIRCYDMSIDATSYKWDFGDGTFSDVRNPLHEYSVAGRFDISLRVENQFGCADSIVKPSVVEAVMGGFVKFPNAFKPRPAGGWENSSVDDGNAIFKPVYRDVNTYKLQIFDRWGQVIFESIDPEIGWDGLYKGELSQQSVYVWKVSGSFISGKEYSEVGTVLLVR